MSTEGQLWPAACVRVQALSLQFRPHQTLLRQSHYDEAVASPSTHSPVPLNTRVDIQCEYSTSLRWDGAKRPIIVVHYAEERTLSHQMRAA